MAEGERDTVIAPEEEAYRYRLEAPVFTGLEDVEQFIQEFNKVIAIAHWPPRVALIQLQMAQTEQAKPYGLESSVYGNFTAPRARFGISVVDIRARLHGLYQEERTPLQDHATLVKRLAQIAYSDLPEKHREHYTYDAFVQSLHDLGLHNQFQAKRVTTIGDALREGEAVLLAKQFHRAQITTEPDHPVQVAVTTTNLPLEAEVDHMTTVLGQLVAILACANSTEPTQGPVRPRIEVPRPAALCWGCGTQGHLRASCLQSGKWLNFHGPRTPSNPASQE